MFKYVHHVNYVIRNRDAMVDYLEKNFAMKPDNVTDGKTQKEAYYNIGQTQLQILEPLDPTSVVGKYLAEHGPGVFHVAWGVTDIRKLAQDLAAKGNKLLGKEPVAKSHRGYSISDVDPVSSHGLWFQMVEE